MPESNNITVMKAIFFSISLFASVSLSAQYYYNDIVGPRETSRVMKTYVENKVRTVSTKGYDGKGGETTDVIAIQEIKENGTLLKASTIFKLNKSVVYSKFDDQHRLIRVTDSASTTQNITTYEYDGSGKISRVEISKKDPDVEFIQVERHQWVYTATGRPDKMIRTVNGKDTIEVKFIADENDNPAEEISYLRKRETDHVYYYFDKEHNLTDIVRYNKNAKKLVPDNMINYDAQGRVIQEIKVAPADSYRKITWNGYQIWRYVYNEQGLKAAEGLFDQDQQLIGRVRYNYTFWN